MPLWSEGNGWQEAAELSEFEAMLDQQKFRHLFMAYKAMREDVRDIAHAVKGHSFNAWMARTKEVLLVAAPVTLVILQIWLAR